MNRLRTLHLVAVFISLTVPAARAAEISGARVNNMACDTFHFNAIGGSKTVRLDKLAICAYHQEKTKCHVYAHSSEFAGTENDAIKWTSVSTTEVTPTGPDNAFELCSGGTFIEASGTTSLLITAESAKDNGTLAAQR